MYAFLGSFSELRTIGKHNLRLWRWPLAFWTLQGQCTKLLSLFLDAPAIIPFGDISSADNQRFYGKDLLLQQLHFFNGCILFSLSKRIMGRKIDTAKGKDAPARELWQRKSATAKKKHLATSLSFLPDARITFPSTDKCLRIWNSAGLPRFIRSENDRG